MKYHIFGVIALAIALLASITLTNAANVETINVNPMGMTSFTINLDVGQNFSGSMSILGGSNNDINFYVRNPVGNTIIDLGRVSQGDTFEFTAEMNGAYILYFENNLSTFSSKTVTLTYDLSLPLIFGVDPLILIFLVFILLIIIGVAVYFYRLGRTQKKNTRLQKGDINEKRQKVGQFT